MKIFFTAPKSGKVKYQPYYSQILTILESTGANLLSPEKGNYKEILTDEERSNMKSERFEHYEAIKRGIEWADLIIIEMSEESFQVGHEATLAIQNKKPVLCLSLYEDFGKKINNPYFFGAQYTKYNVREIIIDFITKHKNEPLNERFNLFLSKTQVNKLEREAKKHKMSKSEWLRKLIEN